MLPPPQDQGTVLTYDAMHRPVLPPSKKEKTSIVPQPHLDGEEDQREQFEKFSLDKFLDTLWEGVRYVQILADASKIEIPFLTGLPLAIKVI